MPWRDRDGAVSPLRCATLLALCLPAALTLQAWATGALGPEPLRVALKETGQNALYILLIALLVTPARQILRAPGLAALRRMVGVAAMVYGLAHLLLYAAHQGWDLSRVGTVIALRLYLSIGFVALLGLVVLGASSTDGAVRRLGGRGWRRLHRLAYPIAVLAVLHFILHARSNAGGPMLMAGCLIWLLAYRVVAPPGGAPSAAVLGFLGVGAAMATAGLEFGWYALATGIDPWRVLAAHTNWQAAPRPAQGVLIGAVLAVAARARRGLVRRRRGGVTPKAR